MFENAGEDYEPVKEAEPAPALAELEAVEAAQAAAQSGDLDTLMKSIKYPKATATGGRRCPGMDSTYFRMAAGATWQDKCENACTQCQYCDRYPLDPNAVEDETGEDADDAEIDWLIDEVESVIDEQNAFGIEAAAVEDYEIYKLVIFYRKMLRQVDEIRQMRQQAFIKSHYEQK